MREGIPWNLLTLRQKEILTAIWMPLSEGSTFKELARRYHCSDETIVRLANELRADLAELMSDAR
jgi:Mor family transcriptional regulator